ncbi:hypothetical protein PORY_002828 [Pneumocystis oryctolagi]|uniref:Uncharacterized protein n=1 Tax=Pneumocystis oryctolagi TaxID=42067 RepID=A0ACB7C824_9ASCO|nr:hypothetical protein PORY_002828 [Pneumocystis oryctolagi]
MYIIFNIYEKKNCKSGILKLNRNITIFLMFSNTFFFQKITCPYIRKNIKCNTIFCPFNHTYCETEKEKSYDLKRKHCEINFENIINTENTTNVDNLYKKIQSNKNIHHDCTNIYTLNKLDDTVLKKDIFQNYSNIDDVIPKFIPNLIHIPHKIRVHFFKLIEQEFLRIYSKTKNNNLIKKISLEKELEILNSTYQNKSVYINSCKNFIISLKKKDILHENITNTKIENLDNTSKYKHIKISLLDLEKYLLRDVQLQKAGYILDIPSPEKIQTSDISSHVICHLLLEKIKIIQNVIIIGVN